MLHAAWIDALAIGVFTDRYMQENDRSARHVIDVMTVYTRRVIDVMTVYMPCYRRHMKHVDVICKDNTCSDARINDMLYRW